LCSCQNTKTENSKALQIDNFIIELTTGFKERLLIGNDLEYAKNIFKPMGAIPPNMMYINEKNNEDFFSLMATSYNLGETQGKNEDFDSSKSQELFDAIKSMTLDGDVKRLKINNINIIKHSVVNNEYHLYMAFYYLFDYEQVSIIFISYPINSTKWSDIETSLMKTLQRKANKHNIYSMNNEDSQEIEAILKSCLQDLDTVNVKKHNEFWEIVDKYGGDPENIAELGSKEKLFLFIEETGMKYQKAFYEDALKAINTGEVFQSVERKELSKNLNEKRIQLNEDLMTKIAKKESIPYNGEEIIMDKEIINGVLDNLNFAFNNFENNINILYSRGYFKK